MQISVRTMAFTIVLLFVGSLMAGLTSEYNGIEPEILEEETVVQNPSQATSCLLYTSPSPRDLSTSRMPSSA